MNLTQLETAAKDHHLKIFGTCDTEPSDNVGTGTLVLLGPSETGFWHHVSDQPEMSDNAPDPMDRWSTRVVTELAASCDGKALFPFGSPTRPFITWALRTGRAWTSPVGLLVHDIAGLMVSYRGAILLSDAAEPMQTLSSPCETCPGKPCLSACPVGALATNGYDLKKCHGFLDTPEGFPCMETGCLVRQSCPISKSYGRNPEQSAYHMRQFHKD